LPTTTAFVSDPTRTPQRRIFDVKGEVEEALVSISVQGQWIFDVHRDAYFVKACNNGVSDL